MNDQVLCSVKQVASGSEQAKVEHPQTQATQTLLADGVSIRLGITVGDAALCSRRRRLQHLTLHQLGPKDEVKTQQVSQKLPRTVLRDQAL